MIRAAAATLAWVIEWFNPPPRESMTFGQKIGRSILFAATLFVGSILVAMIGALGLYIIERGREMGSTPELLKGVAIIVAGIVVNTICVYVLLHIKKADHKLLPPKN